MVRSDLKYIADLDVLRGLAILLVVTFHAQEFLVPGFALYAPPPNGFMWLPGDAGWERFLWNLTPAAIGWSGVDLFLLLSGFLIHWSTLRRGQASGWREFYGRRFWRIYPTYLVALLLFIAVLGPFAGWDILAHVLLIHNYDPTVFYSINGVFWSLALEVQMYLFYPLLLRLNGERGFIRSLWILGSLSVLSLILGRIFGPFGPVYNSSLLRLWVIWAAGAWIAERHHRSRPVFRHHLSLGLGVLLLLPVLNLSVLRQFFIRYAVLLFFAVLLDRVLVSGFRPARDVGASSVQHRVINALAFVGICSYSMYLIHQPVLKWFVQYVVSTGSPQAKWIGMVPVLFVITGLSYLFYRSVELPSIRLGRWLMRDRVRPL